VYGWDASLACVEFLLLGPIEVRCGGQRVAVGGPQAEKALAALLLAGGRVVGLDALVDTLWDAEPPPTAVHQVHKLIGGLRRRLPGVIDTDGRRPAGWPTGWPTCGTCWAPATGSWRRPR
jgi:hypothetical protein